MGGFRRRLRTKIDASVDLISSTISPMLDLRKSRDSSREVHVKLSIHQ